MSPTVEREFRVRWNGRRGPRISVIRAASEERALALVREVVRRLSRKGFDVDAIAMEILPDH